MLLVERAYEWVKSLNQEDYNALKSDLDSATAKIVKTFKDPSIKKSTVEVMFADVSDVEKKIALVEQEIKNNLDNIQSLQNSVTSLNEQLTLLRYINNSNGGTKGLSIRQMMERTRALEVERIEKEKALIQKQKDLLTKEIGVENVVIAPVEANKTKKRKSSVVKEDGSN